MDKKFIVIGLLVALVSLCVVPLVSASYVELYDFMGTPTTGIRLTAAMDSQTSAYSGVGVAFTPADSGYLYNATFQIKKEGTPQGSLIAVLYHTVGTIGSTCVPSTLMEASANYVDVSTLYGSYIEVTFVFEGTSMLLDSENYFIAVEAFSVGDGWTAISKDIYVGESSGSVATQNQASFNNNAWTAHAYNTATPRILVNGNTEEYVGPTPTPTAAPTAAPSTTSDDGGMTALTDALLPVLVPLLVMLIPAFLGLKFVGVWGFMAGLNIGVIITFIAIPQYMPLWGVILVAVTDILLVMRSRG